jgi:glycosyltransferase involved in cell wall biosynthesis
MELRVPCDGGRVHRLDRGALDGNAVGAHMSASPQLTVVIPTYNRKARLERVLEALARQSVPASTFEAVVVDDGSNDGTADALAGIKQPYALRSFHQQNGGPARARNRGLQEAQAEVVLFLDDDVMPGPSLIAEHLQSHDREAMPLVVMGPLSSLPSYDQPWVAWEQAKIELQYQGMRGGEYQPSFRQFWTGNASVGRAHLLEVGGFNHAYSRGEDIELGIRLHQRGLQFRFNPRAVGIHHAERSLESWSQAHRSYGRWEVEIFGLLGEEVMLDMLAGNFSRLHLGTRWLLRGTFGRPQLSDAAERAMNLWLKSKAANLAPHVSAKMCSVLANLLYWQESATSLGETRLQQILARADRMRVEAALVSA